jgi:hypothetical protein
LEKSDREFSSSSERENNEHQRAREEGNTRKREQKQYILTVISILPAGWPPISMSKKTTGLDIMYRKFFARKFVVKK